MSDLRTKRTLLGLSASRLSRLAGVGRFKISQAELGGKPLGREDRAAVLVALRGEAERLRQAVASLSGRPKARRPHRPPHWDA